MRKTFALAISGALVIAMMTATTAWAQAGPVDERTVAFGYTALTSGSAQGFNAHVDVPFRSYVTIAAGGTYVTGGGTGVSSTSSYGGVGPGVRARLDDGGRAEVYGHILLGYLRQNLRGAVRRDRKGFGGRFGGGIDYAVTEGLRLRVGLEHDGTAQFVAGAAFRF